MTKLRDLERGDFIERMAFYIAEINALHSFREGSGRFLSTTAVAGRYAVPRKGG